MGSGGAGKAEWGGVVPNITKFGGQPMLRAYVVLTASCTSGTKAVQDPAGRVTKQRRRRSSTVRCSLSTAPLLWLVYREEWRWVIP